MKQLHLFNPRNHEQEIDLFNDTEYNEWLQEQDEQAIERQLHDSYWLEQDKKKLATQFNRVAKN